VSRFFSTKRLLALLASLIVLGVLVNVTLKPRTSLTWPEKFVIDTLSRIDGWIYQPVYHFSMWLQDIKEWRAVFAENAMLKKELSDYRAMQASLQLLLADNQRLRNEVGGLKALTGFRRWAANVTGRSPDHWTAQITIDIGSRDGIHKDLAVMDSGGALIGRVAQVALDSSKVQLITDAQTTEGISAMAFSADGKETVYGIVTGASAGDGDDVAMKFIQPQAPVMAGMMVVTSGYSTVFPKGILIGKIVSVNMDPNGLTKTATIRPAANLDQLEEVFVIEKDSAPSALQVP
jgi:rod shape-determining protein MreC